MKPARQAMGRNKHAVCFVDDDPEEVRRFRENLSRRFIIGAGTTLDEALSDLRRNGRREPDLFVLDLYFPEGAANTAEEQRALHEAWQELLAAQAKFRSALARLGQSSRGGRRLARRVRKEHPSSQHVFFTRKATLEEGLDALRGGAVSVIKKPDPSDREKEGRSIRDAEDLACRRSAGQIARDLNEAIRKGRRRPKTAASGRDRMSARRAV